MNKKEIEITQEQKSLAMIRHFNRMSFITNTERPFYIKRAVLRESFKELVELFPELKLNICN